MHNAIVALFAMSAGFGGYGIVAYLYRLFVKKAEGLAARIGYVAVMIVAGPTVLFDNAIRSWRKKECSAKAVWLAAAVCSYWSLALGLFVIEAALAI